MAALEKVMQMKQQGFTESQIIQSLREQGIQPREINEALSQSKIKSFVSPGQQMNFPIIETEYPVQRTFQESSFDEMQPSIMPSENSEIPQPPMPQTPTQPTFQETQIYPKQYSQEYIPENQYSSQDYQQNYPQEYYDYQQPADIETINEIAEQVVEEKMQKIRNEISSLNKIKQEVQPEIQLTNKRLEKIEETFHELQMAILKKIGEYGEDIKNISKGLDATQESFSKVINPTLDKKRDKESEEKPKPKSSKGKKSTPDFESYLR